MTAKVGELMTVADLIDVLHTLDPDKPISTRHIPLHDLDGYTDPGEPILTDQHTDLGIHFFGVFDRGDYIILALT